MKFNIGVTFMGRRGRGQRLSDRVRRWNAKMNPKVMGDLLASTKEIGLEKVSRYQADFQFLMELARNLVNKYPDYYNKMHDVMSYLERIWYFTQKYRGKGLVDFATATYLAWRYRGFAPELLRDGAKALGVTIPDDSAIASVLGFQVSVPQPKITYYESTLTISNNSGVSLTDYTLLITLPEDWGGWEYVRFDGSDIHVLDENDNPLYCYPLLIGDTFRWGLSYLSRVGYLWVKIPSIANGETIMLKLRFGNKNPYPSYQDPSKVFIFFDDFETWEGWIKYGNGVVSQDNTRRFNGKYSAMKNSYNDPNGAYKPIGSVIGRNVALEFFVNRVSNYAGGALDRVGLIDDNGNGYGWYFDHSYNHLGPDKRTNFNATSMGYVTGEQYLDRWATGRLAILDNGYIKVFQWIGSKFVVSGQANDTSYNEFSNVYIFGGYKYWVDHIVLRTYVEPEPTVTIGPVTEVEV